MEHYKAPNSNIDVEQYPFRPIRGVIYTLLLSVFGVTVTSIILGIVFGIVFQVDMLNEASYEQFLTENTLFMLLDILIDFFVLFVAGRFLYKYVVGKEYLFAIGISVFIVALALLVASSTDGSVNYPFWYEGLSYVVLACGLSVGVYTKKSN